MYVGQAILRREDERFLRGRGRFVEDVTLDQPIAHAAFVRSPHAHAAVTRVETTRAASMPGVLAVLTGADWTAAGHGEAEGVWPVKDRSGADARTAYRPLICVDGVVRCVGEVVAMVVAEDRHQALDAAEAIAVTYEEKPANILTAKALDPETPLVHPGFGTNEVLVTEHGLKEETEAALAKAHHVTEVAVPSNRITAASMEPRAYLGHYDRVNDRYTVWTTNQAPHIVRRYFTKSLHIPEHKLRVIAPDVGGGFGMKLYHYPEEALVLWGAIVCDRPVRWVGTRSECLLADTHARDHHTIGRMGFDEGRQDPRREVRDPCRLRRLREPVAGEHHQRLSLHHALARLRHPGDPHHRARRLHQRDTRRRLSRRRPARGRLSGRAHDRERRAGDGYRPVGAPRPQPDPAGEVPVSDRPRHHLRFRRPARAHGEDQGALRLRCAPRRAGGAQGAKASGWASASRRSSTWRAPARSR